MKWCWVADVTGTQYQPEVEGTTVFESFEIPEDMEDAQRFAEDSIIDHADGESDGYEIEWDINDLRIRPCDPDDVLKLPEEMQEALEDEFRITRRIGGRFSWDDEL